MTVNEFWARIGINAAIVFLGVLVVIGAGPGGALFIVAGIVGTVWTAVSAQMQIRRMNAAVAAKRAGHSS